MVTHDKESALRGNRIVYVKDGQISGECNLDDHTDPLKRKATFETFLLEMGW